MKTKEDKIKLKLKSIIYILIVIVVSINIVAFCNMYFPFNKSYAKEVDGKLENEIKISNANEINLEQIIKENTNDEKIEQITKKEEVLEYLTQYKVNNEIPKGISYVVQEGRQGKQEIWIKTTYDKEGNFISEQQIGVNIVKSSANKIVEIGGANYTSSYKIKVGDTIYVTSDILGLWSEPSEESRKITTIMQGERVKVEEIVKNWYKISYKNMNGWVKSECTIYINDKLEQDIKGKSSEKAKDKLLAKLDFNMRLNEPSGLSLQQFKKVLEDKKDLNNIFKDNAEYFYYIEKQYNINGVFVAALGIHESAWGTSKIALQKNNIFGYGAYDSNPYNKAYTFSNYSESIDLIARVLVKYYLNPNGINIYGGEKAVGTYYNGPTLIGVNIKYATDKNWSSAVYEHIKYLYNKL